jgi:NADH:quinone reductase (non-electrogenic)
MSILKTKLTELLGIELPILGGTMMDLSTAEFVAPISEAGALGIIASAIYKDYDQFQDDLKRTKDLTAKPFGVNINLFPMMQKLDNFKYLELMAEEGVNIVETSGFAPPEDLIAAIHDHGFTWLHKCVGVRYAKKAQKLGAHGITVVGYENGGATGNLNVTTLVLVPSVVDAVDVPVVGGGGVVDGRTLLAVLALGAAGAIVGTRIVLAEECPIHKDLKTALVESNELSTDVIMRSLGFAHRVWMNEPAKQAKEVEDKGGGIEVMYPLVSGEACRKMYETGDITAGCMSVGQGIGLVHKVMPVKEIFAEMAEEAQRIYAELSS